MLVVFPPSIRHDESIVPSYYEDHLLERVSLLELKLAQVIEKIGMAYEFFARESKELQKDHRFIRAFSEALKEINPQFADELNRKQTEKLSEKPKNTTAVNDAQRFLDRILARHDKPNRELFAHLLKEGIRLLEQKEEKQAFQMLERAALLSPENAPLLTFIGERLYVADKFSESKTYLERTFEIEPTDEKVLLLLGAVFADSGEADRARKFLSVLTNDKKTFVAVNYVWGMLAAYEKNWSESLAAFNLAREKNDAPELDFLVACVYLELENYRAALDFFDKTLLTDEKYSDARVMRNLIFDLQASEEQNPRNLSKTDEREAPNKDFACVKKNAASEIAFPFAHFKQPKKQLLTNGSPRLNKFFRRLIFNAIELIK